MHTEYKYTVTWTLPYQGEGESTAASDSYPTLRGAYRRYDEILAELGRGARPKVLVDGVRVSRNGHARA